MSLTRENIVRGAQDGRWSHSSGQDILDLWDRAVSAESERDHYISMLDLAEKMRLKAERERDEARSDMKGAQELVTQHRTEAEAAFIRGLDAERDEARKTALRDVQTSLESQTVSANELPGVMWAVGVIHRLRALAGSKTE